MMAWYYFSFAKEKFYGGVYAEGSTHLAAYVKLNQRGLNPGGEVAILGPLPEGMFEEEVPESDRWRLLTKEEVEA